MKQPLYRIQAVTQRTGIPSATLRAWERRYGFPKPSRADNSTYRLYSEQDIFDVLEIKALCESGMSPSEAVSWLLSTRELASGAQQTAEEEPKSSSSDPQVTSAHRAYERIIDVDRTVYIVEL